VADPGRQGGTECRPESRNIGGSVGATEAEPST
jgi:hypothetical protein